MQELTFTERADRKWLAMKNVQQQQSDKHVETAEVLRLLAEAIRQREGSQPALFAECQEFSCSNRA